MMRIRDFLLLSYDAFGGRVHGKTALQKKLYFLGIVLDYDLGFEPHYYGPYSPDVADANSELKSLGYLSESVTNWGGISPQGFEIARYDYELSDDGRRIVKRKKKQYPDEWQEIEAAAEKLNEAGSINYMELALAAKAYFILDRQGGSADMDLIKNFARKFGWSISEEELDRAGEFLEQMGLVTRETED